jgi:hypothetical protein
MPSRSSAASVPPLSAERREPSLAEAASPAPRLVPDGPRTARPPLRTAVPALPELHAGERSVLASESDAPAQPVLGSVLRKLGFVTLVVLALVGAASLLRPFVGL